ncbi:30S ribosome-binding factor RbfA [Viridibacterium curvum]|uniref:Ribosome-binding factor A n=1 Tax=Viridibacterium curvum TaxID=1101404 RepID=A0ABP9QGS7_9RHOO
MPKDYSRSSRVVEQIKRELAELIRLEVKDPRVGFITITDVEITPDYAHAKVFFSSFKGKDAADEAIRGLRSASAFLRRELGRRVRIHTTPELHFHYDNSIEEGTRLSAIIDKAMEDTAPADDEAGNAAEDDKSV